MKQILFKLFENLKQLGIKPNIGSRTNVTPIRGSEIDRLINRPVTPKEFDYSKPEVVDSMRGIVQNASDYVGQFTERQLKTFNDNVERILGVIKPKEITADVVDLATKEKITGPGLESLMKEKGVAPIGRKTIEAETLIKQFLDDDLISLNAKQIDQLSRGKAEDVFENIFGSKAKELITGKNTNESLNEVYNKLKTTKDTRGRLPDDPNFDPSDINFKDGGSVSEDVKQLLKEEFIELINADPESFPDTNAGFRRFLKRKGSPVFNYKKGGKVGGKDKSKAEEPLSNYKSYSENELLSSLDAKMPNLEIIDDELVNMPMFEPRDVVPKGSVPVMPSEEYIRQRLFLDLAKGGRVKKRKRYADGGNYYGTDRLGNSNFFPIYKDSLSNDYTTSIEGTKRDISPEEILSRYLSLGGGDSTSFNPANYNQMSNDYYSQNPQERYAEIPLVNLNNLLEYNNFFDPNTGNFNVGDFSNRNTGYNYASVEERNPQQNLYYNSNEENYNPKLISNLINQGFNIPYVKDNNELVQDIKYLTNEDTGKNEYYGITYSGKKVPLSQIDSFNPKNTSGSFSPFQYPSSNTQAPIGNSQGTPFTNQSQVDPFSNIPQVDPFTGDLTTQQDKLEFQMPQDMFPQQLQNDNVSNTLNLGSSDPALQALGKSVGSLDYSTMNALRNNKSLSDYFTPMAGATYGKTAFDAFNQIGLTPAKQALVNQALSSPSGIASALLGEVGGGFKPIQGGVGLGEYIGQGLRSLGQAATLNTTNLGVNPSVGGGTLGSRVLGNLIGAPAIYATALLNPTTMGNAELTPQMRAQQTNMKKGGRVNMSYGGLTKTIPPVRGPNPQGVESLFKRRYN